MRSKTSIWFECKVRYEKTMEDGTSRKVTEVYVVDALSFSEAEKRITEEASFYVNDRLEIADLKIAQYKEVFSLTMTVPTSGTRQNSPSSPLTKKLARRRKPLLATLLMPRTSTWLS